MDKPEVKPRRSLLFVPADRPDRIRKAATLPCDCVIMDLEDGVDAPRKPQAREHAAEALATVDFGGRERILRINGPDSEFMQADLEALARFPQPPDIVMVAKVEEPLTLEYPAIATVESAAGILAAEKIAQDMRALMFGAYDFAASIGAAPEWEPLLWARSRLVVAAAAAGIDAIDSPWADLRDLEGLRTESLRARRLGFVGKGAIHPGQLEIINAAFTPSAEEVEWARKVVEAAEAQGEGAIRVEGRMVDRAVVRVAMRTMRNARFTT